METTDRPAVASPPLRQTAREPSFWEIVREDKRTNLNSLLRPGFQAMFMYRLGRWAAEEPGKRRPFIWLAKLMRLYIRNFYGIEMYWSATIGRRFAIGHQGAIVMHQLCTIGDDCTIRQGVTIGVADEWDPSGGPILGNNVDIGAGAMILGKVRIGNNVRVGPTAVVTTDVPDNATVFAPPSRIKAQDTDAAEQAGSAVKD
jgi:serine O-acetyltransferase